jgi:protein-S-isoprenylcysteine O-methyltransferase Ste14
MWRYFLCAVICVVVWVINGKWLIEAKREHIPSELYEHSGLGIFFTLLTLELTLGSMLGTQFDILWLEIIGFILFAPSAHLVATSWATLRRKGKTEGGDPLATTTFINTGIFQLVRHPIYLGMALWSIALILVFQSIMSLVLGGIAIFCFRMASQKEDEFNIRKFGDSYEEYMRRVPRWNVFKGLKNLGNR